MSTAAVGRGFAVLSAGQMLSRLLAFAVIVHLSRVLGPEGFGVIVFATSVLGYAALAIELGFDTLGPLEVARGELALDKLVRTVVSLRLILLAVAYLVVLLFVWLAPVSALARTAILVYGLSLVTNVFDVGWVYLGGHRMGPVAAAEIASQAIQATGAFLLIRRVDDLLWMPWIFGVGRLIGVGGLAVAYCRSRPGCGLGLDRPLLRRLLPMSLSLSGATVVGALLASFDVLWVALSRGAAEAGLYGAAYRVAWVPTLIAAAYFTSLRPALARSSASGFVSVAPLLRRSLRIVGAVGLGVAAGGYVLAEPLMLWLYGPLFGAAAPSLRLLLIAAGLLFISRHYRAVLQAFRRPGLDFAIMSATAALSVALNLALVPRFGILAAAATSAASEVLILIGTAIATRRAIGAANEWHSLAAAAGCALLMAGLLSLTGALHVLLRVAAGALIYMLLLFAVGGLRRDDLRAAQPA